MNRWNRILPAAFIMYTIAYIDRTNFALAIPSLQGEFMLSSSQAGLASGVFFIGYVLCQMPGGYFAQIWSPKRVIFWSMLAWGVAATLCGYSKTLGELILFRFLLGIGEGGVWPATIVLLANWFAPNERARANGYWVLCQPVAIVISNPFSGWLIDHYGWRQMFVVQGMLPIVFAAVWWWAVQDRPSEAKWLKNRDKPFVPPQKSARRSREAGSKTGFLRETNVWIFLVLNLTFSCGAFGLLMWLPTVIRSLGARSNVMVGVLSALPYLFSCLGAIYNSRHSDRTGERRWHVALSSIVAGVALIAGFLLSTSVPFLGLLFFCVTGAGIYATLGPKWAFMTEILPQRSAGVALGLINSMSAIGGLVGPYVVGILTDKTKTFTAGFAFLSVCLVLSGLLALSFKRPQTMTDS